MRRHLHCLLPATVVLLGGCNSIFGIQGGSLTGSGGDATGTGAAGTTGTSSSGAACTDATFPLTPLLDPFNGADGSLGTMWSVDMPGGYQIAGDQLLATAGTPGIMVWSAKLGATQEAYIKVVSFDPSGGELELILKNQGIITECDSIEVDYQPSGLGPGMGMLGIYACSSGNPGTYGSAPFTLAPGDQFGARACADGKVLVFKNGALVNTFDVSPFPYAGSDGRIGFFSSSLAAPGARLDDFGGGTVP